MKQSLIIIPPLGVNSYQIGEKITQNWYKDYRIKTINWQFFWENSDVSYVDRLERLINEIDRLNDAGSQVSLLGLSAGGSIAINAFFQRKNRINAVINVCGRLHVGKIGFPKSENLNDNNHLFQESVTTCEKNLELLSIEDRKRILTIRPLWDEYAPTDYAIVDGAKNIRIVSIEHIISILLAMTVYKKVLLDFLKKEI